ncbi:MAG: hypothetical protein KGH65_04150 [Candidatus Micrarchaeota archaeon]|nr:hypothetical protein [Candidatus Micrarchaeota archaeon]
MSKPKSSKSWISGLAKNLGLKLQYISFEEVVKGRSKGFEAGEIVRTLRSRREKKLKN